MKTLLITNIPSPYRVTVFDELHKLLGEQFSVFYTMRQHPSFNWKSTQLKHQHYFVNESNALQFGNAKGIYKKLQRTNPEVIITCGFSLMMLKAMVYALLNGKKLVANTDAWELNERGYSFFHILLRKIMYKRMKAFIPVSKKGALNFARYHIPESKIFISHYAIDNAYSAKFTQSEKTYDIMFSGQFIDRKMPFFFCEIAELLSKRISGLKVLLIGDGELKEEVMQRLRKNGIDFTYPGFVQKEELPAYYASARIFLFPTKVDSWGVVANDACAVGTPVITCDNAGAAGDLVIHDYNGFVLPINASLWAQQVEMLLSDSARYEQFSRNCLEQIKKFNPEEAAGAFMDLINYLKR